VYDSVMQAAGQAAQSEMQSHL